MNILITGASGFIGSHLTNALINQGHQVTAANHKISVNKIPNQSIKTIECDFNNDTTPEKWINRLDNIDIVINAVGIIKETKTQKFKIIHTDTPIALFKACEITAVKKIIQISALGADESAFSQFHISKKIADNLLMTLNIDWVVIMPSVVFGSGANSMNLFKAMAALPITPLVATGNQLIQPIHINDFCAAVIKLVKHEHYRNIKIAFVGADEISLKNLFILLKKWLSISSYHFVQVPYSIVLLLSKVSDLLPVSSITSDSIKMLHHGNVSNVAAFTHYFGFKPLSISEALRQIPAHQADRWQAKLIWLKPLLRISIAFVWIFTGVTSLFMYPLESSYALLKQVGITTQLAAIVLYSAALMDFLLGLATLFNYRLKQTGLIQISIISAYTIIISLFLPEQWLHPFGAISKNLPLILASLIIIILHDKNQE
ncbi:MAG: SDR family oxidoreductase [Thiohalomonadales bacterium]